VSVGAERTQTIIRSERPNGRGGRHASALAAEGRAA
jgi:hypothetical protein